MGVSATARAIFAKLGFAVQRIDRVRPVHGFNSINNPCAIDYIRHMQPAIIDVPLRHGRAHPVFSFANAHPFVLAASAGLTSELTRLARFEAIRGVLATFYQLMQPQSALELVGLDSENIKPLSHEPPWALVLPWESRNLSEQRVVVERSVYQENKAAGSKASIADGWAWCGPVSDLKLDVESRRLLSVLDSVTSKGYQRNDGPSGDVVGVILSSQEQGWRWQASTGQHRAAVLAALGWEFLPLRVTNVIRREDVSFWPNVCTGLYTREQALQVFDMIFHCIHPPVAARWLDEID